MRGGLGSVTNANIERKQGDHERNKREREREREMEIMRESGRGNILQ